jgi:hypothetical protein
MGQVPAAKDYGSMRMFAPSRRSPTPPCRVSSATPFDDGKTTGRVKFPVNDKKDLTDVHVMFYLIRADGRGAHADIVGE